MAQWWAIERSWGLRLHLIPPPALPRSVMKEQKKIFRPEPRHLLWPFRCALMQSYVFDVVRGSVPKMDLDRVFEVKQEIAHTVESELEKAMKTYGYQIVQTLIVDVEPDPRVKAAMNEINAAQRLRVAANEKAEAEKILQVKRAEGDAEAKYLAGVGVARQRQAIVDGLRESVLAFADGVPGTTPKDVMDMVSLLLVSSRNGQQWAQAICTQTARLYLSLSPMATSIAWGQVTQWRGLSAPAVLPSSFLPFSLVRNQDVESRRCQNWRDPSRSCASACLLCFWKRLEYHPALPQVLCLCLCLCWCLWCSLRFCCAR